MVHFATTNENVSKGTNQSTERNSDGTTNKSKRNFPVTPHPASKKKRSADNSQSDNLSSLVSNTSSPQMDSVSIQSCCNDKMKRIALKTFLNCELLADRSGILQSDGMDVDGNADGAEVGDDSEGHFDSEWDSFKKSESFDNAPNLKSFLLAQSARKTDAENFSIALDECLDALNTTIHDILNESVVRLHNEQGERFEAFENDIVGTMKSNHKRRHALLKCMDDANEKWGKQYRLLRGVIGQSASEFDLVRITKLSCLFTVSPLLSLSKVVIIKE